MSAVAAKPRARTASAAKKPPVQQRHATPESIAAMRAGLREADQLIVSAWDACDEEDLADAVLEVMVEVLTPDTLQALTVDPLLREPATRARQQMARLLSVALVVSKQASQQQVSEGLMRAVRLIEATMKESLDRPDWLASLPTVQPRDELLAPSPSSEPVRQPENTAFHDLAVDALSLARTKVQQAMCVLKEYGDSGEPLAALGLIPIVDTLDTKLDQLIAAPDMGTPRDGPLCDASCHFLYSGEIARIVGAHENDVMLQAVASLLEMAKGIVDDANDLGLTFTQGGGNA